MEMVQVSEFQVKSGGGRIWCRILQAGPPDERPLVILCHGIPTGGPPVEDDPGYEGLARELVSLGASTCYFNFRGTGLSEGNFSLAGWLEDLGRLAEELENEEKWGWRREKTCLMGFSGGGAVAILHAARNPGYGAVVSVSAPSDLRRLLPREMIAGFIEHARKIGIIRDPGYPPDLDVYYRELESNVPAEEVAMVSPTPLLIVHGDEDETVPVEEAHRLYQLAGPPKDLAIIEGGGHRLRLHEGAMDTVKDWLEKNFLVGTRDGRQGPSTHASTQK
ncbi:MAG: alpha/beta fold hydrolase [Candidatus Geothermincolales bacterium]